MNTTSTPSPTLHGLTFWPVPEFDRATAVFGPPESAYFPRRNLPEVPRELEDLVNALFFKGGALPDLAPQVDRAKATTAIRAWLCSFAPAHEAKTATAAYAIWVWQTLPPVTDKQP